MLNSAFSKDVNFLNPPTDDTWQDDATLWRQLDLMKQQIDESQAENDEDNQISMNYVEGTAISLTAGVVSWVLRGGALMTSFLSSVPLFKHFDPLPILNTKRKKCVAVAKENRDDETSTPQPQNAVEEMFKRSTKSD